MRRPLTRIVRNWLTWLMALVLVVSLAVWFFTRETLPRPIRIGTGVVGGLYYEEGQLIAEALDRRTRSRAQVEQSTGSVENCRRVRDGEIDVAIVQAGAGSLDQLAIVTPLHRDVVHLFVRRELLDEANGQPNVSSASHLAGRSVVVGLPESGMQESARDVLRHYGVEKHADLYELHFTELLHDEERKYAAAIVTTGIENDDVQSVLNAGEFGLLRLDAEALAKRYRHFEPYDIPKNFWPPVPRHNVPTVAASALVVVREDASSHLVELLLDAIYEDNLPAQFPTMFLQQQAKDLLPARLHPITRRYHDPFGRYGVLHTVLEGLAAGKELLFALGAAFYLVWDRWRRLKEGENQEAIRAQKNHLDAFLDRTLAIEREQMKVTDPRELQGFLDDVTTIKLEALSLLTHEDLRGDRTFAIFLMQCANLISKIQLKIINYTRAS